MHIGQLLSTYRRGKTVSFNGNAIGTLDGTALIVEVAYSPRPYSKMILMCNVREMVDGRYTGRVLKHSSESLKVL